MITPEKVYEVFGITPGPWYDYISPELHKCWVGTQSDESYYVAEIIGIERPIEKLEANTKLITASPEMLVALVNIQLQSESIYNTEISETYYKKIIESADSRNRPWSKLLEELTK